MENLKRKVEPWEINRAWLWVRHRGLWHVAKSVHFNEDARSHWAYLACEVGTEPVGLTLQTALSLKQSSHRARRFCCECHSYILTQMLRDEDAAKRLAEMQAE